MEKKHTQGPWIVETSADVGYDIRGGDGSFVVSSQGVELEIDAELIAAAPDMLEALKELRYACTDKAEVMADAAIYKATGNRA